MDNCHCSNGAALALRAGDDLLGVWASSPDAGGFFNLARAAQHVVTPVEIDEPTLKDPIGLLRPSNPIGPTDLLAPMPMEMALCRKMATVDVWTPNTIWGGGYIQQPGSRQGTYLTIQTTLKPALELPRYSYAAMDTDALYAEAQRRVEASYQALFGGNG